MRAVLHTGGQQAWAQALGERPWSLMPIAGRPLLSYWLELCVDLGIQDVQIILGRDAEYVEMFCSSGEKWGLSINYSFIRTEDDPQTYLSRDPERWSSGLLYMADAVFLRRTTGCSRESLRGLLDGCCVQHKQKPAFFISRDTEQIRSFIRTGHCEKCRGVEEACTQQSTSTIPDQVGVEPLFIQDITHYYRLNMEIVQGEMGRYLSSGYASVDKQASIGVNVITPPSVTLTPPLAIGNDCRIGALSEIGPNAVISDHVLIDRQCEIADSIILSDTYVGRNLEVRGKIVAGNRIIDPEDGTWLDIEDPWLVAQTRPRNYLRDLLRAVFSWCCSLLLATLQLVPFVFLYSLIRLFGRGRFEKIRLFGIGGRETGSERFIPADKSVPGFLVMFFCGMSLDRFPRLLKVLSGHFWLCGQVPRDLKDGPPRDTNRYFPAVFSYPDAFADIDRQMDALYYAHTRSLAADLRILRHAFFSRLVEVEFISGSA